MSGFVEWQNITFFLSSSFRSLHAKIPNVFFSDTYIREIWLWEWRFDEATTGCCKCKMCILHSHNLECVFPTNRWIHRSYLTYVFIHLPTSIKTDESGIKQVNWEWPELVNTSTGVLSLSNMEWGQTAGKRVAGWWRGREAEVMLSALVSSCNVRQREAAGVIS